MFMSLKERDQRERTGEKVREGRATGLIFSWKLYKQNTKYEGICYNIRNIKESTVQRVGRDIHFRPKE